MPVEITLHDFADLRPQFARPCWLTAPFGRPRVLIFMPDGHVVMKRQLARKAGRKGFVDAFEIFMVIRRHHASGSLSLHQHEALVFFYYLRRIFFDRTPNPCFGPVCASWVVQDESLPIECTANPDQCEIWENVGDMDTVGAFRKSFEPLVQTPLPLMYPLDRLGA